MSDFDTQLRLSLRERMVSEGLTVNSWSKKAGLPESTLRSYLAGRSETITVSTLEELAKAIKIPFSRLVLGRSAFEEGVTVIRARADEWRAPRFSGRPITLDDYVSGDSFDMIVPRDPRYVNAVRFGLRVEDNSCDQVAQPNSIIMHVSYADVEIVPQAGDIVFCEEVSLREKERWVRYTVRRLVNSDDSWWLIFPSSSPKWLSAIQVQKGFDPTKMALETAPSLNAPKHLPDFTSEGISIPTIGGEEGAAVSIRKAVSIYSLI